MDCDPRDFLDPDEEYEMMYADELEMMRDWESEPVVKGNNNCPSRKSLKFANISSNEQPTTRSTSNSIATRSNLSSAFADNSATHSANVSESERHLAVPSISKPSSPLLEAELDDIDAPSSDAFRISVNGTSSRNESNKRAVEELFGDIDDIDFSEDFLSSRNKRTRIDETSPTRFLKPVDKTSVTINRILECRKRLQNQGTPIESIDGLVSNDSSETSRIFNITLTRRVPRYAFMTLRNGKNEKFYAKLHSNNALNNKNISITDQCKTQRLLTVPFENILLEANTIVEKKFIAQDKEKMQVDSHQSVLPTVSDESELWVEKYKPTSYLELLSDEGTNRILLQWLKLWDKVVFGRENFRLKKSNTLSNNNFKFSKWKLETQLEEELDEAGCPKRKIALLCGPPGLGKTTLAHVIAKHAGYNVIEMNASDDRSPEAFKLQLEAATQMRAVLGATPKPNCLVIDEIDGAPANSIDLLLKFVKGELKNRGKKKINNKGSTLKRPIICICNDVYVPALRPLRQMAFVVHFPSTSQQRLAQRLIDVARIEKIKTDIGAMLALCEKTNNDIRNCISTIHCLKEEKITTLTIRNANIGVKDMQKGLFTVWQEIFQIQSKTIENNTTDVKNVPGKRKKTEAELLRTKRMVSTLRTVQSSGDYDRLIQGVYENFLNVPSNDSSMQSITTGMEWFCFMDHLKTVIANSQTYTLMAYMPYSFVAWNFLFATYQRPKLNYPNLMYELFTRQTKQHQIIHEVLKGMEVKIRAYCHHEQLLLDTLPLITYVLNPHFRQVSVQLFSVAEKETLRQLVNTMIDYNLNFVQERLPDGSYEFNLDPNVDEVIEFPGVVKTKRLTYALKLMIGREIEQEKIRRLENSLCKTVPNGSAPENTPMDYCAPYDLEMELESSPLPQSSPAPTAESMRTLNHLQKLTPKEIKKSAPLCSVTKDFFGRVVEKQSAKQETTKVDEIVKSNIWFHFKEGFSNAVRRTVYIKDLVS